MINAQIHAICHIIVITTPDNPAWCPSFWGFLLVFYNLASEDEVWKIWTMWTKWKMWTRFREIIEREIIVLGFYGAALVVIYFPRSCLSCILSLGGVMVCL
jgi:hypothetical protein